MIICVTCCQFEIGKCDNLKWNCKVKVMRTFLCAYSRIIWTNFCVNWYSRYVPHTSFMYGSRAIGLRIGTHSGRTETTTWPSRGDRSLRWDYHCAPQGRQRTKDVRNFELFNAFDVVQQLIELGHELPHRKKQSAQTSRSICKITLLGVDYFIARDQTAAAVDCFFLCRFVHRICGKRSGTKALVLVLQILNDKRCNVSLLH